ncbi:hypothetical protein A8926_6116 [Saccharopolyspora spinosa]|uniref:Uncharacterized protein n=1 Tax=Saccharopolyspora spinosa TaxID=60894 RepID=A0A2N3Y5E9_SACSN|nr:hypothetical protein A8926_6116 [Saccharopolyspora spinosa]
MRHGDGPQVPLKSKVRFQWNLRILSAEADSMNVFAPAVTASTASTARAGGQRQNRQGWRSPAAAAAHIGFPAHRLQSPPESVHATPRGLDCGVGRSSATRIREAKNTRARFLDRPSRLGHPDDLLPETAPSSRVPPGQNPPLPSDQPCTRPGPSTMLSPNTISPKWTMWICGRTASMSTGHAGHRTAHRVPIVEHLDVRDAVRAVGDRHRQIGEQPARCMHLRTVISVRQRGRHASHERGVVRQFPQHSNPACDEPGP